MEKEQWCWRISVPNLLCDVNYQCPLKTEMHSSFTLIRTINIRRGASSSLHFVCPLGNKNNGRLERAFDQKQELSLWPQRGKIASPAFWEKRNTKQKEVLRRDRGQWLDYWKQLYTLSGYFSIEWSIFIKEKKVDQICRLNLMVLIVLGLCGLFKFISRLIIQITLTFLTYSEGIHSLSKYLAASLNLIWMIYLYLMERVSSCFS